MNWGADSGIHCKYNNSKNNYCWSKYLYLPFSHVLLNPLLSNWSAESWCSLQRVSIHQTVILEGSRMDFGAQGTFEYKNFSPSGFTYSGQTCWFYWVLLIHEGQKEYTKSPQSLRCLLNSACSGCHMCETAGI